MSYLRFDKTLMVNLQESLPREILRTNKSGAYHCTTIVDCNTRKYHGLLVIPVPNLDDENHVLLSSLDETVIQHGAEFNLGLHKYQGNNFSPNGHKYIREFDCEHIPATTYRVGGVIPVSYTHLDVYKRQRIDIPVSLPFKAGITLPTALAAPVEEGMMLPAAARPPLQSFIEGPSTVF